MEEIEGNRIDLAVLERLLTRNGPGESGAEGETDQNRTAEDDGATRIPDGAAAVVESRQVTGVEPETKAELRKDRHGEAAGESSTGMDSSPEIKAETKPESKPQMKAKIVDIPFARWDRTPAAGAAGDPAHPPAELSRGCKHEKSDGRRCGKAIWQNGMCGVHGEWHNTMAAALGLPFPDDQMSLHRFLLKTLDMVVSGKLQARQALAVEGICKMIFKNIRTGGFEM